CLTCPSRGQLTGHLEWRSSAGTAGGVVVRATAFGSEGHSMRINCVGTVSLEPAVWRLFTLSFCSRAKNVVAPARPPVRFFSPDAPVMDLFLGQLEQVDRLRSTSDISFIFFYAPWCAHSIAARDEVQKVARKLSKEVLFIAVNCWWSQGKCRKRQNLYQYPVVHLFYRRFGPIEYKGPFAAAYVEKFIQRVITPVTYLPTQVMLQDFLSYHESGVVGYFDFNASPQPPGYMIFLTSALQALKKDFQSAIRFGVITSRQVAEAISVREDETIYMHRHFNTSLIFPRSERNFTAENICSWAYEHSESILRWLQPPGAKSRLLEQELSKGPALLLFVPFDPLAPHQPLIHATEGLGQTTSWDATWEPSGLPSLSESTAPKPPCCNTVVLPAWHGLTRVHNVCELCLNQSIGVRPNAVLAPRCPFYRMEAALDSFYLRQHTFSHLLAHHVACSYIISTYSPFSHYSACCKTLSLPMPAPPPAPEALPLTRAPWEPTDSDPQVAGIAGLKCRTNKTLRFYLLDSHLHWNFAVRLGAQGDESQHLFAAIVNLPDEVHYVLEHRENLAENLERFIQNFSVVYSPLKRHLVGASMPKSSDSLIREVTTVSFFSTVMDPEKDVLLFYYTQWCGFCTVINHVIIQLARLFQGNGKFVVARINVAENDLPWEFMVDHFPVFLLFPSNRKHASVKFPDDLPITLPNLVRFILRHSSDVQRGGDGKWAGPGRSALLEWELRRLRGEVQALRHARERLSRQLSQLWQEKRRLALHAQTLESRNGELQKQGRRLEELYQEKNRQLLDAVSKLQALADASESLLSENALLKILLASLKEKAEPEKRAGDGAEEAAKPDLS
uniref:Thioredoxin domain containing 11 n=1 Tax=Scleropages formosus TaxID=113540 RepID=A0A8C9RHI5_SCLFO